MRALRKFAGKKTRSRGFMPFDEVKSVLVAYDEAQANDPKELKLIKKFVASLKEKGKMVYSVVYFHRRKTAKIPPPEDDAVMHLSKNDFNTLGMPKTAQVKKIMAENFDYFINLNLDGRMPLKSIAGFTNATCRIGYNREKSQEFYDIILGDPNQSKLENFIADMEFYLQKIG